MKLAIKGDSKRGKEVIEILSLFGGFNHKDPEDISDERYYYVNSNGTVESSLLPCGKDFKLYTIDALWAEYPYKVGDTVRVDIDSCIHGEYEIDDIDWAEKLDMVVYIIRDSYGTKFYVRTEDITPITKQNEPITCATEHEAGRLCKKLNAKLVHDTEPELFAVSPTWQERYNEYYKQ